MQHIVVRYGEMSLKGKNRADFERLLLRNVRTALRPWPDAQAERVSGRILVTLQEAALEPVLARLQRVFGVISLSPVTVTALHLEAFQQAAIQLLREFESNHPHVSQPTFKIEV
ncbi:MAG: tRNA 4-thiouridine(8) synthase ThiI, partial [Alicyclobacillus sp.]|nr:tRNA 4-thiouridine(8) synthase ThiI [Alicyclobacillus sp.]